MMKMMDDFFAGLSIRPVTRKLVKNLILDLPLSPAKIKALGVASAGHYRLLQQMVSGVYGNNALTRDDVDYDRVVRRLRQLMVEIDKVLGNKVRLQALIQENVGEVYLRIYANTTWDNLFANHQAVVEEE